MYRHLLGCHIMTNDVVYWMANKLSIYLFINLWSAWLFDCLCTTTIIARAGHLGIAVPRCGSKIHYQNNLTIKRIFLWARPNKITYDQIRHKHRRCKKWHCCIFIIEKFQITISAKLWLIAYIFMFLFFFPVDEVDPVDLTG